MRQVLRIGHRGAAGHAPENTLAAIQKGIALGVDLVEIDVRRTADGVLVVLHDATVNRTTDGKGRVDRLSLADVKKFNAGNGEQIPTLEEVLKMTAGRAGLMLELKIKGAARQAVETVREAGFSAPVIYASFLHDELIHVRAVDPGCLSHGALWTVAPSTSRPRDRAWSLPTSVSGTTQPRAVSSMHSTERACSCSSIRQTSR